VFLDLIQTVCADAFAVKENDVVSIVAENACGMILLKDDTVVVGENFDGVLNLDIHCFSDFNRENDSAQLVYFSDHSGGFHKFFVPFIL
jgi:hypothetical protein